MNSLQPILIRPSFQYDTKWTKKRVKCKLRTRNCGEGYWMREPQISLDHSGEMYCSVHSVHAAIWYDVTMSRWIDCLSRSYRSDIYQISQMRTIWQSIIHTHTRSTHTSRSIQCKCCCQFRPGCLPSSTGYVLEQVSRGLESNQPNNAKRIST